MELREADDLLVDLNIRVAKLEDAEQARLYPDICPICGGCIAIGCHDAHMRKHGMDKPAPVVERFVLYDEEPYHMPPSIIMELGCAGMDIVRRRKRGDVVATWESPYWVVRFPTGDILRLAPIRYSVLKANRCFGDQV